MAFFWGGEGIPLEVENYQTIVLKVGYSLDTIKMIFEAQNSLLLLLNKKLFNTGRE